MDQLGDFINKHLFPLKCNTPRQKSLAWEDTSSHPGKSASWFYFLRAIIRKYGRFIFSFLQIIPQSTSLHCFSQTLLCFSKRETLNLLSSTLKGLCPKPHNAIVISLTTFHKLCLLFPNSLISRRVCEVEIHLLQCPVPRLRAIPQLSIQGQAVKRIHWLRTANI